MFCVAVKAVAFAFAAVPVTVLPLYAGHFPRVTPPRTEPVGILTAFDGFFLNVRSMFHKIHHAVVIPQVIEKPSNHSSENHRIIPF